MDKLNTIEWSTLCKIKNFLALLKSITKSLERHSYILDQVILSIDFILSQFKKAKVIYINHNILKNMINSG